MACGDKVDKTKPYGLHKGSGSVFHPDCMDKPKSAGKTKSKRQKRSNNPNIFGLYTDKKGWMAVEKTLLEAIKKGDQKSVVRLARLYSKYGATDTVSRELISKHWDKLHPTKPFNYNLWYSANPTTFTVYFDGKQEDVQAEGQWDAMQKVIQKHKIPKKRQGLVSALHKGTEAQSYMFNPDSEEYSVYNATDGIYACPFTFESKKEAERFIRSFRERFKAQGYYLTANGNRISPDDVILEIVKSNPGSGVGLTTKEDFLKWWSQGLSLGLIKTDGKVWQGPDSQRFLDWWAHGFTLGIVKSKKPHIEQGESIMNYIARALTLSLLDLKGRKPTVLTNPCSTMRRPNKRWRVSMLSPPPVTKHILKEIELGPSSTEYDVKQQLIREGIAGEILGITLINPATWESYPGGKLGGAWDDIDFTEQDVKNRIIPKGTRESKNSHDYSVRMPCP